MDHNQILKMIILNLNFLVWLAKLDNVFQYCPALLVVYCIRIRTRGGIYGRIWPNKGAYGAEQGSIRCRMFPREHTVLYVPEGTTPILENFPDSLGDIEKIKTQ